MKTLVIKTNDKTLRGTPLHTELILNKNVKGIIDVSAKIGSSLKDGEIDSTSKIFEENNTTLNNEEILRIISHLGAKKKLHISNEKHIINIGFEEEDKDSCFLLIKSFNMDSLGGIGTGMVLNKNDIERLIEFLK